ncbi:MAG: hypothetical protein HW403_1439 [Dehalococcoidia bacterium]|nr:hypothetical protein [Dehalococcoidia bacterium]
MEYPRGELVKPVDYRGFLASDIKLYLYTATTPTIPSSAIALTNRCRDRLAVA